MVLPTAGMRPTAMVLPGWPEARGAETALRPTQLVGAPACAPAWPEAKGGESALRPTQLVGQTLLL